MKLAGYTLEIVNMDHRSSARRSIENIRRFVSDPQAIAVIGGVHSPVYIPHLDEIQDSGVPLLLSWSAAGILTRQRTGSENSVFRLSVDDNEVGPFMARELSDAGCQNIGFAVNDSTWGTRNLASMSAALLSIQLPHVYETTVATEIGAARANHIAAELATAGVDCLGLVGNFSNSAMVVNAIDALGHDLRIFSHWGILAGGFVDIVPHDVRTRLGVRVVQTCGLNPGQHDPEVLRAALNPGHGLDWEYESLSDVHAPAGFVHAHDLGQILVAALDQASREEGWSGDITEQRRLFISTLEALETPVDGILRTYRQPYSQVSEANMSAHEALTGEDLCFAQFDERDRLVAVPSAQSIEEASLDQ